MVRDRCCHLPTLGSDVREAAAGVESGRKPSSRLIPHENGFPGMTLRRSRPAYNTSSATFRNTSPSHRTGAQLLPAGRTARLVEEDGVLVADATTPVDDDVIFA